MGLESFTPRVKEVPVGNTTLVLRGVSLEDVIALLVGFKDQMETLFDAFTESGIDWNKPGQEAQLMELFVDLAQRVPDLFAKLIATSAGTPELWVNVRNMSLPEQFEAITGVAEVTFVDAAGFARFVGKVTTAIRTATAVLPRAAKTALAPSSVG